MIRNLEEKLYFILFGLMAGIVTFNVLEVNKIVSMAFYGTFVLVMALWGCKIKSFKVQKIDLMTVFIIAAALLCVVINAKITNTHMSFGYFKKVIFFSFTIIFLRIASEEKISKKATRFVLDMNTMIAIFLCMMFVIQREKMYMLNDQVTKYLTFCFNNPNEVALFETCSCFTQGIRTLITKETRPRIFHGILCAATAYFIWESQSRNAQMAVLAFAVLALWIWFPKRKSEAFDKKIIALLMVLPLLFALLYVLVIDNPVVNYAFSFMVSEGKKLSSRMKIWGPATEHFLSSPIVGAYSQISEGTGLSQMHNTHLDILASYGTVVYFLVVTFLIKILGTVTNGLKNKSQQLCVAGFMGAYLLGLGEAAMFSGGLGIYILIIQFLLLARSPLFEEREIICESYLYRIISTTIKKRFQKN